MIYKRGKSLWYKFRWTVKHEDGTKEKFTHSAAGKSAQIQGCWQGRGKGTSACANSWRGSPK